MKKTLGVLTALVLSASASAHTLWLVPSHYVLSKQDSWVAVDAAAANMTFQADKGINLTNLKLYLPDGSARDITDTYTGKRKSMADIQLGTDGTYRVELAGAPRFFTSYEIAGERKRLMADKKARSAELPKGATKVQTTQSRGRSFAYITVNGPTDDVLAISGEGLEVSSNHHPADIVANEQSVLTFYIQGKPQVGVKGVLSFDGEMYRNDTGRIEFETDKKGQFSFTPATAGRYLIEASYSNDTATELADIQRDSLTFTFEVALP